MRRRRQFAAGGVVLLLLLIYVAFFAGGSGTPNQSTTTTTDHHATVAAEHFPKHSPLNPEWTGNGKTVTLGFGGDVHFAGAVGSKLAKDPSTALGDTFPQLFAGTQLTHGEPRDRRDRRHLPRAPEQAVHLRCAGIRHHRAQERHVSVTTEANDHGMDCGPQGLSQNLTIASQAGYPIIGIGNTAAQAFSPYRITIDGQRIAIIAATQVIADNLISTWTATATTRASPRPSTRQSSCARSSRCVARPTP